MPTTLPNMSIQLPALGGDSGTWDDTLNLSLGLVDVHDHSVGKGVKVPTAGININADLSFASLYAPTNLHRISFASVTALAANNKSVFVSSADNELYWRTNAGVNVKITSGAALNVSAFTGGIGGDYTSVAAALNYDDSNTRYTHKGAAGTNWAKSASGAVQIFETGTAESVSVNLTTPAALGSSYDLTFPTAVPAATTAVLMNTSGTLLVSGALTGTAETTLSGTITPSTISGATNNYAPTGFATATVLRMSSNAGTDTITGIAGGAAGRVIVLINVGVTNDFIVVHESASSTAANRIELANSTNVTVRIQGSLILWYDGSSSRWRAIGGAP